MTGTTCGARRPSGEPCRNPAGHGTDHAGTGRCKFHGGASPNGRKAARAEAAHLVLAHLGEPAATDPVAALGRCLDLAAGNVAALTARVAELAPERRADGSGIVDDRGPHPLVSLWQAERDRLAGISADALRIGLEGRRVRLAEAEGEEIVRVILYVLEHTDMALTPEQVAHGRGLAAGALDADAEEGRERREAGRQGGADGVPDPCGAPAGLARGGRRSPCRAPHSARPPPRVRASSRPWPRERRSPAPARRR